MATKDEILSFVKAKGPVIPNQIKKELGGETFLISAQLSELSIDGKLKISNTKIGGSPTYYAPGQEYKLQELKKHLNEKDQKTYDLLKEKKVLRDKNEDMLIRVGLRNIKDFAKPLRVNIKGEKEIFWKWYLTPIDEVEAIIRKQSPKPLPEKSVPEPKPEPVVEKEKTEEKQEVKEVQKEEKKEELKQPLNQTEENKEGFIGQVYDYFNQNNIEVIKEEIIRKKTDLEFEVMVPSAVGKVQYFCKAKNKKKCTDGDLSSVYLTAQSLKLPVLFLITGEVTKKAKEMLNKEFKGLVLKKI